MLAVAFVMAAALASAEPGDAEAVARARKDYARAMQGHDIGLQNAMKVELAVQLAKAKERAQHRKRAGVAAHRSPGNSPDGATAADR